MCTRGARAQDRSSTYAEASVDKLLRLFHKKSPTCITDRTLYGAQDRSRTGTPEGTGV